MAGEMHFLQSHFSAYYKKNPVSGIPDIHAREFGVGEFGKKITKRHLSFKDAGELNAFLVAAAPFYISYSAALYSHPAKTPMPAKGFFGADLVYEFDADDIKTSCKKKHDSWECPACNAASRGSIENCTSCGARVRVEQWFCSECLDETKKQVFRLLGFLEKDFGFSDGISVNFSGNAGYHVHVRNPVVRELSHDARIELLDYLTANNLLVKNLGFDVQEKRMLCSDPKTSLGWSNRIISGIVEMIEKGQEDEMASFGHASVKKVSQLLQKKEGVLRGISQKQILSGFSGGKAESFWLGLASHVIQKHALKLDRQTSMDISKIIRLPDTIHGSTGLVAKTIPLEKLSSFKPLDEAVAFPGRETVRVFINKSPRFYLSGQWFEEFEKTSAELPLAAGVYLLARGAAVLGNGLGA